MIAKNDMIRYKPHLEQLSKHHPTSIHNQDEKFVTFLVKALGGIVNNDVLALTPAQKKKLRSIMMPFKDHFLLISNPKKRKENVTNIRKQYGSGLVISSLIAAAIPLISSLISKITNKK